MSDRLCLFLPSLRGGGAERVMVNLAQGFSERGLSVDLVLARAEGPYLSQVPLGVRVVDLRAPRVLASLPGLVRYLRQERPEALLSAVDHANVVALWARTLARVPVRVVLKVPTTLSRAAASARTLRARLIPFWVRAFYPWADTVVAVSRGVAEDLIRLTGLPEDKVRVVYNGVVTPELLVRAEEPLNHPWFAPGSSPVVLGVGRLTAAKDFPMLVCAFSLLREERAARLMILGEGEERASLEALVRQLGLENDVALPGFVENPYKYMKRAAVFVLSSCFEGFSTVLVEAMAIGTPVVSTDCPSGPVEILEGGKWGRLVPLQNAEAMAQAMAAALDDPNPPEVARRATDFGVDAAVDAYLRILGVGHRANAVGPVQVGDGGVGG